MKIEAARDNLNRNTLIRGNVEDYELSRAMSPQEILNDVRHMVSRAIADKVMERLGPAIDAAVRETFAESTNDPAKESV